MTKDTLLCEREMDPEWWWTASISLRLMLSDLRTLLGELTKITSVTKIV